MPNQVIKKMGGKDYGTLSKNFKQENNRYLLPNSGCDRQMRYGEGKRGEGGNEKKIVPKNPPTSYYIILVICPTWPILRSLVATPWLIASNEAFRLLLRRPMQDSLGTQVFFSNALIPKQFFSLQ